MKLVELSGKIILKLYEIKAINPITKDIETDIGIIKPILKSRIMDIDNVVIEARENLNKIEISVYDGDILEIEFAIENLNQVQFRGKKKVRIFGK